MSASGMIDGLMVRGLYTSFLGCVIISFYSFYLDVVCDYGFCFVSSGVWFGMNLVLISMAISIYDRRANSTHRPPHQAPKKKDKKYKIKKKDGMTIKQ